MLIYELIYLCLKEAGYPVILAFYFHARLFSASSIPGEHPKYRVQSAEPEAISLDRKHIVLVKSPCCERSVEWIEFFLSTEYLGYSSIKLGSPTLRTGTQCTQIS
jgi:hypothetical protein